MKWLAHGNWWFTIQEESAFRTRRSHSEARVGGGWFVFAGDISKAGSTVSHQTPGIRLGGSGDL